MEPTGKSSVSDDRAPQNQRGYRRLLYDYETKRKGRHLLCDLASNKNVNRMNTNAVAASMAPLLLRPLLVGDCEIEDDFDVGGDGSMQLLQAAAAANHAQAIVITLLEEDASKFGVRFYLSEAFIA
ncbi:hypothetical protein Bca4012_083461 [Brassica carinata]